MMTKFLKKYPFVFSIFFVLWAIFLFYSRTLFLEIPEFTTEGASLIIKMLEFTTYRSNQLMTQMGIYFILLSFNLLYVQFIVGYDKTKQKNLFLAINALLIIASVILSNIFAPVTIFLIFLSFIIVWSSQKVYTVFAPTFINYDAGDLVYSSEAFNDEETANKKLNDMLQQSTHKNELIGEVIQEENQFYFTILATTKLQIDKKELL